MFHVFQAWFMLIQVSTFTCFACFFVFFVSQCVVHQLIIMFVKFPSVDLPIVAMQPVHLLVFGCCDNHMNVDHTFMP